MPDKSQSHNYRDIKVPPTKEKKFPIKDNKAHAGVGTLNDPHPLKSALAKFAAKMQSAAERRADRKLAQI